MVNSRGTMAFAVPSCRRTAGTHEKNPWLDAVAVAAMDAAADLGPCFCERPYGPDVILPETHSQKRRWMERTRSTMALRVEAQDSLVHNGVGQDDTSGESTTTSSSRASANVTGEVTVGPPRWFAKNVRQVCDRVGGRPRR